MEIVKGHGCRQRRNTRSRAAVLPILFAAVIYGVAVPSAPSLSPAPGAGNLTEEEIVDRMLRTQSQRVAEIVSFTRLQHYAASDRRFSVQADMMVRMTYERGKGKRFDVISRTGSPTIQTRVFDRLLAAEVEATKQNPTSGSPVNPANYKFRLVEQTVYNGRNCYLLEIQPRRKKEELINGKAWVDSKDFDIIHEEGRPSASLSFWIGRPMISSDYEKIESFWFIKRRHSLSDSFLLGHSELTLDYSDYHVVTSAESQDPPGNPPIR